MSCASGPPDAGALVLSGRLQLCRPGCAGARCPRARPSCTGAGCIRAGAWCRPGALMSAASCRLGRTDAVAAWCRWPH
eukprot:9851424-Alexandrium_andersonii.AAC.1